MAESEKKAFQDLAGSLRAIYLATLDRKLEDDLAKLQPAEQQAYAAFEKKVGEAFEAYANQRGPLQVQLANLVGFPDPDPLSQRDPPADNVRRMERFNQAKALREKIRSLDAAYEAEKEKLEADDVAFTDQLRGKVMVAIQIAREEFEKKAVAEAQSALAKTRQQFEGILQDGADARLRSLPGIRAPAGPPPTMLPAAPSIPSRPIDLVSQVKTDLAIWVAGQGYRLGPRNQGRDVTKEFMAWRNRRLAGR